PLARVRARARWWGSSIPLPQVRGLAGWGPRIRHLRLRVRPAAPIPRVRGRAEWGPRILQLRLRVRPAVPLHRVRGRAGWGPRIPHPRLPGGAGWGHVESGFVEPAATQAPDSPEVLSAFASRRR